MKVIDYKKVKLNNIKYHEPVKTAGGCLISRTFYKHLDQEIPIYIQTPRLKVNSDLEILDSKTYIELELDKRHINFYEFINNIDDQNIKETFTNSKDWFQEKLPMDVVDDFYKTNIKMRKYNKSPIIKFKIPLYKNNSRKSCDIFGDDLKPVDVNEIKQNTDVICILELEGIKFFKQRFETEWKVVQLRVYKPKEELMPCLINESFLSDNEDAGNHDPFPEDGISLTSSMASDIAENEVLSGSENQEEDIVKNISIQVPSEKKTKTNSVNVEKVEENISLEITSPESGNNNENQTDKVEVENITIESPSKNIEIQETNISAEETNNTNEESESVKSESDVEENTYSLESDIEEDEDEDEESINEDPLENYFSDNFTDEEEICDGLESNLEEVNFLQQELTNNTTPTETLEEEVNLDNSQTNNQNLDDISNEPTVNLESNNEEIDKEYQNKSIRELIDEISKFKKLALDRENEMTELKSKYRNLYSELNL